MEGRPRPHTGSFDKEAARAAILYASSRVTAPSFHKLSKVFYFADRLHLERYGSLMFGDEYWALRFGPVPMHSYRFMDEVRDSPEISCEAGFKVVRIFIDGSPAPVVRPLDPPDMEELSAAVLECLDESIGRYGEKNFWELTNASHDAAWNAVMQDEVMSTELIAQTLPNAEAVLEYLSDPHP